MTIREFVRRQLFTYVGVVVLVYFGGLLLMQAVTPGSIPFVLVMAALCIVTLFVIDRLAGIPCRNCGKPLGSPCLRRPWDCGNSAAPLQVGRGRADSRGGA